MEKRSSGCPACLSAWLAVPTASRMESAQLGVAIDPLRSITCPSTMVDALGASLHAAQAKSAAAIRIQFFICVPCAKDRAPFAIVVRVNRKSKKASERQRELQFAISLPSVQENRGANASAGVEARHARGSYLLRRTPNTPSSPTPPIAPPHA